MTKIIKVRTVYIFFAAVFGWFLTTVSVCAEEEEKIINLEQPVILDNASNSRLEEPAMIKPALSFPHEQEGAASEGSQPVKIKDSLADSVSPPAGQLNKSSDNNQAADTSNLNESPILDEQKAKENELISVNFENVDIRDVVRILADKAQINMVVGPEVAATVNLQLNNVSWEKALEVILKTYKLTYKKEEGLVRIMTLDEMKTEDEKIPLTTKIITLNFARASEIKSNFENMLSSRGRIDVSDRTNSIIITDLPDNITKIEAMTGKLDTRTPQVLIEALMADVKVDTDDQLGINWDLAWPEPVLFDPGERKIDQILGPLSDTRGSIRFGTTLLNDKDLHAVISFLQTQQRVNVLAHPQILTLDNLTANINLTEEIPYELQTKTSESATTLQTTSFKQAGINLAVTPHITTKDNFVYMKIDVKQSFRSGFTKTLQPIIDSRSAQTNLLVRNRETAIIGGLRRKNDSFTLTKLPLLGDIPLLGAAFRKRVEGITETDLMIFVTPTVVEQFELTANQQDRLELFNEKTNDWVGKFDQIKKKKRKPGVQQSVRQTGATNEPEEYFYLRPPLLKEAAK